MNALAHVLDQKAGISHVHVAFEFKQIGEDADDEFFRFEGLGSTFGNIDSTGDRINPGAFVETLARRKPSLLFGHDMNEPVGVFDLVEERAEGLFVKGRMPKADHFVQGRIMPQMKIGSIRSLSIGFFILKSTMEENIRIIQEVELLEISLVTIPANDMAKITDMRSRSGTDFDDHPIDFKSETPPGSDITQIINEKPVANWNAIVKTAVSLLGTKGGSEVDVTERPALIDHIERYYAKAGRENPFRGTSGTIGAEELDVMSVRQIEGCLQGGVAFTSKASKTLTAKLRDADRDGQRDADDLVASIHQTVQSLKEMKNV